MRNKLRQTVTHWESTGSNKYGEESFNAPVTIEARWEDRHEQVRLTSGEEYVSKSIVFVPDDIGKIGDYLAKGDLTGINDPALAGGREIQAVEEIPSLRTSDVERRMIL